jgi:hypothetical protein
MTGTGDGASETTDAPTGAVGGSGWDQGERKSVIDSGFTDAVPLAARPADAALANRWIGWPD